MNHISAAAGLIGLVCTNKSDYLFLRCVDLPNLSSVAVLLGGLGNGTKTVVKKMSHAWRYESCFGVVHSLT